jgi:hypothetical protein
MRRIELVLFVCGISVLAYLYGVASGRKDWLPAPMVEDGWRAAEAFKEVWDDKVRGLPPGAIDLASAEPIHRRPSEVAEPNPHRELFLITGGPYKLMEFCPRLGCLAWLMDRRGVIHHVWPIDPSVPWGRP